MTVKDLICQLKNHNDILNETSFLLVDNYPVVGLEVTTCGVSLKVNSERKEMNIITLFDMLMLFKEDTTICRSLTSVVELKNIEIQTVLKVKLN